MQLGTCYCRICMYCCNGYNYVGRNVVYVVILLCNVCVSCKNRACVLSCKMDSNTLWLYIDYPLSLSYIYYKLEAQKLEGQLLHKMLKGWLDCNGSSSWSNKDGVQSGWAGWSLLSSRNRGRTRLMWTMWLVTPNFNYTVVGPFILRTVQGPVQHGLNFYLDGLLSRTCWPILSCRRVLLLQKNCRRLAEWTVLVSTSSLKIHTSS